MILLKANSKVKRNAFGMTEMYEAIFSLTSGEIITLLTGEMTLTGAINSRF